MILIVMTWPADHSIVMATSATYEQIEAVVAEWKGELESKGWTADDIESRLRAKLPSASLPAFEISGYFADEIKRAEIR